MTDVEMFLDGLELYCNSNAHLIKGTPTGIVIEFPGLGGGSCVGGCLDLQPYETPLAKSFADNCILHLYAFPGPWSYMNDGAVRFADTLIDAATEKYKMDKKSPIIPCGGSMGGHGALRFTHMTKHRTRLVGCMATCPVTDLVRNYTVFPDKRRYYISAIINMNYALETGLRVISSAYNVDMFPNIKYYISCDENDEIAPPKLVGEFANKLKTKGYDVVFHIQKGLGHGGFEPGEYEKYRDFMINTIKANV